MLLSEFFNYIENNKVSRQRIKDKITDERGVKLPQRNAYLLLRKYAKDFFTNGAEPRMIALSGLRGVGKTTLAWQLADYVYNNFTTKIYFISVDEITRLGFSIFQVITALENVLNKKLDELQEKIMIIFDEVHEASQWQKDLKILYEKSKKIFILATGSSALLLCSSPDLATRWSLIKVYPFRFPEFILAKSWFIKPEYQIFPKKGLTQRFKDALFYSSDFKELKRTIKILTPSVQSYFTKIAQTINQDINRLIDEYVSFHNIARFLPLAKKSLIIDRILDLFERILQKDLPQVKSEYFNIFYRILFRLALSDEINYQTIAKEFSLKETEVEGMIDTLNKAEIINIYLPHASVRKKTSKTIKPFFMSPSLRRALYSRIYGEKLTNQLRSKLYEDTVAMYLKRILSEGLVSFGFGKKKNPDFVIETMDTPILMEIGLDKKTTSQLINYCQYRYGIIINAKLNEPYFIDDTAILFLPFKWFLLL